MPIIKRQAQLKAQAEQDSARLIYDNGYSGVVISLVASTLLAFGFDTPHIAQFKFIWWVVMMIVVVCRLADILYWQKHVRHSEFDGYRAVYRFSAGAIMTAIGWCVYCLVVMKHIGVVELAFNIIIVSALAGGAVSVLAAHRPTAIAYVILLLLPFSLLMLAQPENVKVVLGVLGASSCFVLVMSAIRSSKFTSQAIIYKNENAVLVESMEEEVQDRTAQIYELSNIDPLTNLYNRKAFLSNLKRFLDDANANDEPLALLFVDLDGFKKINDTSGHDIGDTLLQQTASRLQEHSPNSQLLCRWGGDEFLIGLQDANLDTATLLAEQLIKKISEPYVFPDNELIIGATIGVAFYPEHAKEESQLIQVADTAMYFQKKTNPSTVGVFSEHIGQQLYREQFLKTALYHAIENTQLRLVFQPILDSRSLHIISFEALLRWRLNDEEISPYEFISIAEQYGQIRIIGQWVLLQACLAAKQWQAFSTASVSVNVSVIQLQDDNFIDVVDNALAQSKLDPERLHIEITESVFASDKHLLLRKVSELQRRGIGVSIDDFGTEYSSLSVIQALHADIVKIDRSFVANMASNGMPIIKAVLEIAKALDYKVVAEGVETTSQAEQLIAAGVHYLQGYFYAMPLEQESLEAYVQNHQHRTAKVKVV